MVTTTHLVLVPGAGSDPAYWEPLRAALAERGVASTAVDLPCTDPAARLEDYAEVIATAVRAVPEGPVQVVGHSFGAFTAPLVADLVPVARLVLVAPMIPAPAESASQWWAATGQTAAHEAAVRAAGLTPPVGLEDLFYNTCSPQQRRRAADWDRDQAETPFVQPWPRSSWPEVPTEVVALAEDLLFPPGFVAQVARDRLGLPVRTSPGGHMGMVSHPGELAEVLLSGLTARREPRALPACGTDR
ncbi:MAG TPA: alpha/beta hydrolase [Candidatus Ruania gallistercoris]|uniref:Alpha/beta hydrolase n=1 Tax=Candidatus Ruania gallistercoris TaxID=2838746 RepID=A0A9D2EFE3_9MICO|nr:alpha/beta hydrolase [Candidatus Ruania gallistercoris]